MPAKDTNKWSKKYYEHVADTLRRARRSINHQNKREFKVANEMIDYIGALFAIDFEEDSPQFRPKLFYDAADITKPNSREKGNSNADISNN